MKRLIKLSFVLLAVFSLSLFLPGCKSGPDKEKTDKTGEKGNITFETKEGESFTVSINSGELPEGWPPGIPVLPGGNLLFSQTGSKGNIRQINIEVKMPRSEALEFYMDKLNSSGWDIQSTMSITRMHVVTAKRNNKELILQVSDTDEGISHIQIIVK